MDLRDTWVCYRLVQEGLCTMQELCSVLSIDDVDMMVMAQNAWHDAQHPEETKR